MICNRDQFSQIKALFFQNNPKITTSPLEPSKTLSQINIRTQDSLFPAQLSQFLPTKIHPLRLPKIKEVPSTRRTDWKGKKPEANEEKFFDMGTVCEDDA